MPHDAESTPAPESEPDLAIDLDGEILPVERESQEGAEEIGETLGDALIAAVTDVFAELRPLMVEDVAKIVHEYALENAPSMADEAAASEANARLIDACVTGLARLVTPDPSQMASGQEAWRLIPVPESCQDELAGLVGDLAKTARVLLGVERKFAEGPEPAVN